MPNFNIDIGFDKQSNTANKIDTRNLITQNYEPYELNVARVKPRIKLLEKSLISVDIPEVQFCNKLPSIREGKAVEPYIMTALKKFEKESSDLVHHCSPVNYKGKNKDRIKKIILEYIDETFFNQNTEYFRKSDIRTDLLNEKRGAFRVISYYQIEPLKHRKQRHSKHYLNILFLDPYHLFLPSRLGEKSAAEYTAEVYEEVSSHTEHIQKYISD